MKKSIQLLMLIILLSCSSEDAPEILTTTIVHSVTVRLPETSGSRTIYSDFDFEDLDSFITNSSKITDVKVNSLSYKFKNLTGNSEVDMYSYRIYVNGRMIEEVSDPISLIQAVRQGTVFKIESDSLFDDVATHILINPVVVVRSSGWVQSDESPANFDIEVTIGVTATF